MQITQTGRGSSETPYALFIDEKCFAAAERITGAYIVRWPSNKPKVDIAETLRRFYSSIKIDIVDRCKEKLLPTGVYENYNGKESINPRITQTGEGVILAFGRAQQLTSLDDYCANTPTIQDYFSRDFNDNVGSVRIVTPYCDMFIEQWGGSDLSLTIMTDESIDLSKQITQAMRATVSIPKVATHPHLEIIIRDVVNRLREQKPEE